MFHPSIIIHFISEQGCGGAGASPSCRRLLRGWVHPRQVTSSSQHQHVETNNHSHSHSCLRSMWSHQLPLGTRTRADMVRTYKLCTERSLTSGIQTLTFLSWRCDAIQPLCLKMIHGWIYFSCLIFYRRAFDSTNKLFNYVQQRLKRKGFPLMVVYSSF